MIAQLVACMYLLLPPLPPVCSMVTRLRSHSQFLCYNHLSSGELLPCQFLLFGQGRVFEGARSAEVLSARLSSLFRVGYVTMDI